MKTVDLISGNNFFSVATIGVIRGFLIEFIASINLLLYGIVMKQSNAFHICLERTHRYLIAYKMTEKIECNKDETLEKSVSIMANAPMITPRDIYNLNQDFSKSKEVKNTTIHGLS